MDEVDEATERNERRIAEGIARAAARPLAKGHPGDCSMCGEFSQRLVGGVCAPCRDEKGLP